MATRPPTITNRQKNIFPNPINNLHPKIPLLTQEITHPHVQILAKAMISKKQLTANRNNALHSTGPKSAEGKRRSRVNAVRHNLTGQLTFMTPEDRQAHDHFCQPLKQQHAVDREQAMLLSQLSLSQGLACDPARDGFVFSTVEINASTPPHKHLFDFSRQKASTLIVPHSR